MTRKELFGLTQDGVSQNQQTQKSTRYLTTGLAEYTGAWTNNERMHLLRRTLFGVTHAAKAAYAGKSLTECVDALMAAPGSTPTPPLNNYGKTNADPNVTYGSTWINAIPDSNYIAQRRFSFKAWYFGQILNQELTILEKMVLFWHNHFATEVDQMPDARMSYYHNKLFRDNALGNFKTLTRAVTLDPCMLTYLNGRVNTKTAPDENYARELQELFTMGKGPDSKYTEDDVKAAARVLTGWSTNLAGASPVTTFTLSKHDTTDKQFSSFYNNTKITGNNTANAGNIELDALLDMLFAQNEVSKFLCRKLYRWFCYYEITPETETNVIEPLAAYFKSTGYDIKLTVMKLLKSEHFFDAQNQACMIKDPVQHLIGLMQQMEISMPDLNNGGSSPDPVVLYTYWNDFRTFTQTIGLDLGDPPNVAGWPAWYQEPLYYRSWITSDTLPKRNLYQDTILVAGYKARQNTFTSSFSPITFTAKFSNAGDADTLISDSIALLLPMDLSSTQKANLKAILLPGGIPDYNWSSEWSSANNVNASDHATALASATAKLRSFYKSMLNLAEYQLS